MTTTCRQKGHFQASKNIYIFGNKQRVSPRVQSYFSSHRACFSIFACCLSSKNNPHVAHTVWLKIKMFPNLLHNEHQHFSFLTKFVRKEYIFCISCLGFDKFIKIYIFFGCRKIRSSKVILKANLHRGDHKK